MGDIDLDKAAELLRGEGCIVVAGSGEDVIAYGRGHFIVARSSSAVVRTLFEAHTPDEADALADALTHAAALCRRIETECRRVPEDVAARLA